MKKSIPRLQDVFETKNLTGGQQNFLKVLAVLPKIKQLHNDKVTDIDIAIANDANAILSMQSGEQKK